MALLVYAFGSIEDIAANATSAVVRFIGSGGTFDAAVANAFGIIEDVAPNAAVTISATAPIFVLFCFEGMQLIADALNDVTNSTRCVTLSLFLCVALELDFQHSSVIWLILMMKYPILAMVILSNLSSNNQTCPYFDWPNYLILKD